MTNSGSGWKAIKRARSPNFNEINVGYYIKYGGYKWDFKLKRL